MDTPEGRLELRRRGEDELMISIAGRVLMTTTHRRSERTLAEASLKPLAGAAAPRVLIGGLGLGLTLRAALDVLPKKARVVVAELNARVVEWVRGPAAAPSANALADPRVEVVVGDVTDSVREAAKRDRKRWDAIVVDLYEGPGELRRGQIDPLYGPEILATTRAALAPGGVYAVWSETRNAAFEARLKRLGFEVSREEAHGGGPRHTVYLARVPK